MLSEVNQEQKDKHGIILLLWGTERDWTHRDRVEEWLPGCLGGRDEEILDKIVRFWRTNVQKCGDN